MAEKKPATRSHEHEIEIGVPARVVWRALTEPKTLTRWYVEKADVEPRQGGRYRLSWGAEGDGEARIDVWEPNRRLRLVHLPFEGAPPMPDGWAADLAGAWSKFAALAAEHEKELVRSDNIEFQRDWLLGALLKLRLLFRMPHNRDEVKACDAGVEWIVEMLNSVDAEPKTVKPLADEEAACVGAVLDQSVVPDALRRMLAVAVCETMSEVRRILEHGGTTPQ